MSWVIASIPFWILGTGALTIGLVGTVKTVRDIDSISDAGMKRAIIGIIWLLIMGGGFFLLAAKICS